MAVQRVEVDEVSDTVEGYRAIHDHRRAIRAKYGVPCPECQQKLPKACPTILLPQQQCRVHRYRDPRPELTNEQWGAV